MRSKITTVIILLAVCTLATGCKIRIEVGSGGHVESKSGQYYCEENSACVVDVVDYLFFEEFVAVPNEGQVFFGWKEGTRAWTVANFEQIALHRLCPGLEGPCAIGAGNYRDTPFAQALIDQDTIWVLEPRFGLAPPVLDPRIVLDLIVVVEDKLWLQVDLFTGLSWEDINAVCPGGACVDGGNLNGIDMTGWTWASINDANALFNYYIGSDELGTGPDRYNSGSCGSEGRAIAFYEDGWRTTVFYPPGEGFGFAGEGIQETWGWLRDEPIIVDGEDVAYRAKFSITTILTNNCESSPLELYEATTRHYPYGLNNWQHIGAWFYRDL